MPKIIKAGVDSGRLHATTNIHQAVQKSEATIVCVGTPSRANGRLDLQYIESICDSIGSTMKSRDGRHTVIIRSTMVPGFMKGLVIPHLEASSGMKAFTDFGHAIYPEFLCEGTAIKDFLMLLLPCTAQMMRRPSLLFAKSISV